MSSDDTTDETADEEPEEEGVGRRPLVKSAGVLGGAALLGGLASDEASAANFYTISSFELGEELFSLGSGNQRVVQFPVEAYADFVFAVEVIPLTPTRVVYQEPGSVSNAVAAEVRTDSNGEIMVVCTNLTGNAVDLRVAVLFR